MEKNIKKKVAQNLFINDFILNPSEPTRAEIQQLNSPERTTQPISSRMNHMTPRDPAMMSREQNHVCNHHHSEMVTMETSLVTEDIRTPTLQGRMSGMQRTDSLDTAGSQISDLCHSLSQLTKGQPGLEAFLRLSSIFEILQNFTLYFVIKE